MKLNLEGKLFNGDLNKIYNLYIMNSKKYYKRKGIRKSRQNKRNSRHKRTKQIRRLKKNKTRRSAGMLGRLRGRSKSSWNPPPRNTTNSYTREIVEEKLRRMREKRMKEEEYNKQHNITPHNIEKTEVRAQKAAERAQEAVNRYLFNFNWIKQARLAKEKLTEQKIDEMIAELLQERSLNIGKRTQQNRAKAEEEQAEANAKEEKRTSLFESMVEGIGTLNKSFMAGMKKTGKFAFAGLIALIAAPVVALANFFGQLAVEFAYLGRLAKGGLKKL